MNQKPWSTKEEVMRDLAQVSGSQMAYAEQIDESFLVVGNAPPPIKYEAEDNEMLLQFGDTLCNAGIEYENEPPDLAGITAMIRMVQQAEIDSDVEDFTPNSNCVISISKGSKLNPNVREFVPKGASSSQSSSDVSEKIPPGSSKTDEKPEDAKTKESVSYDATSKDTEVEDMVTVLKNKISDSSKADSFESKKQNNVAIASLLQLYANKATKSQDSVEPVKLITPDFYETRITPTKELATLSPQSSSTAPILKGSHLSSPRSLSSNEAKSEPLPCTQNLKSSPMKLKPDPSVQKSIEKVNEWMAEKKIPVQKKAPGIYLGPISFKRKQSSPSKSSSSVSDTEQKPATLPQSTEAGQYRPSTYAADLGRKYMERNKTKEAQKINSWTDLDVILKQKDEILLKKRLAQANENSQSPNSLSSAQR